MKVAILGAGKQAFGALYYLIDKGLDEIIIADAQEGQAQKLIEEFEECPVAFDRTSPLRAVVLDATNNKQLIALLKEVDAAFNALPYSLALEVTNAAIKAKTNLVDLGGNNDIVKHQFELSYKAKEAGITILPDCGIAPGFVSIVIADIMERASAMKESVQSVKAYVGGLPVNKDRSGPLQYGITFSVEGLINEYTQPVETLRHGKKETVDGLSGLEEFSTERLGWQNFEAFATSGGISTLPDTYRNKIDTLEYKTLRFPGHHRILKTLQAIGQLNAETLQQLIKPSQRDQLVFYVKSVSRDQKSIFVTREYAMHVVQIESYPGVELRSKLSAMMQCTAFPAAALLLMTMNKNHPGFIKQHGVLRQEQVVNTKVVMDELRKAGLNLGIWTTLDER